MDEEVVEGGVLLAQGSGSRSEGGRKMADTIGRGGSRRGRDCDQVARRKMRSAHDGRGGTNVGAVDVG
jgi:hypothetical protein